MTASGALIYYFCFLLFDYFANMMDIILIEYFLIPFFSSMWTKKKFVCPQQFKNVSFFFAFHPAWLSSVARSNILLHWGLFTEKCEGARKT